MASRRGCIVRTATVRTTGGTLITRRMHPRRASLSIRYRKRAR